MSDSKVASERKSSQNEPEKPSFIRQAESKATHLVEESAYKAEATLEEGERIARTAGVQVKEGGELMADKIKQSPFAAVALAFGAGVLFAATRRQLARLEERSAWFANRSV